MLKKDTDKTPKIDVDGSEAVSAALRELLNQFPGIVEGETIQFATVPDSGGIGFFPTSGAVFQENKTDVLGRVKQVCQYPFTIVYRAAPKSETRRLEMKEFLDTLGKWLERQPVIIHENICRLVEYPALASGNRMIQEIKRASPAYLNAAYPDGMEDWTVSLILNYKNEFVKSVWGA